jgi:Fur family zinc uptake transcriptional regulator
MTADPILTPFKERTHDHSQCVTSALTQAEALCHQQGLRLTDIRRRVLELVWDSHAPAKAYEILGQLHKENPRAAPPTVYRALDFLLEVGLVHRIESCNAYVGCGNPATPHGGQFLICNKCHAVAEIDDPQITRLLSQEAAQLNFKADQQTVEIHGICPECGR